MYQNKKKKELLYNAPISSREPREHKTFVSDIEKGGTYNTGIVGYFVTLLVTLEIQTKINYTINGEVYNKIRNLKTQVRK